MENNKVIIEPIIDSISGSLPEESFDPLLATRIFAEQDKRQRERVDPNKPTPKPHTVSEKMRLKWLKKRLKEQNKSC